MSYRAAQIANHFIRMGIAEGVMVDPLKVQKLVYFAHGWHLAFFGTPLIFESVEAWKYGPVVPDLYRAFRRYGYDSISHEVVLPDSPALDAATVSLLNQVWERYGQMSGIELSALTHQSGYAWEMARKGTENNWNSPNIPNAWIKYEFDRRLAEAA